MMMLRSNEAISWMEESGRGIFGSLGERYCFSDGSSVRGAGVHARSARYAWEGDMSTHVSVAKS
jgi:hypothetical protein